MFAFENWHSALEMKRYVQRYIHHIAGSPDFSALAVSRNTTSMNPDTSPWFNIWESFHVQFHYGVKVTNVLFDCSSSKKMAVQIDLLKDQARYSIGLTETGLVFITNGGCVENSSIGSQHTPANLTHS